MAEDVGRAIARVNLAAIERNCARLTGALTAGTELCAVVKADGYGHGAAPCAAAALQGGARWLAVATAEEAAALRAAGVEARLLVMGALTPAEIDVAAAAGADVTTWDERFVTVLAGDWGRATSTRRARPRPPSTPRRG
jgi:alanine racemase